MPRYNINNGCRTFPGAFSTSHTQVVADDGIGAFPYIQRLARTYLKAAATGNTGILVDICDGFRLGFHEIIPPGFFDDASVC